jgi:hypothetical protein
LLIQGFASIRGEHIVERSRSYFGILRVQEAQNNIGRYTSLQHGTTLHGQNFRRPAKKDDWGNPTADYSRYANTYYHRYGPVGVVMEKFNWFKRPGAYWGPAIKTRYAYVADNRMPASTVGLGPDVWSQLVAMWAEPPFAVIGLGTGTMASYARPGQVLHYYEIDNQIRRFSENSKYEDGRPYFTYVQDARDRGADVWILMGDARLKMAQPYEEFNDSLKAMKIDPAKLEGDSEAAVKLRRDVREHSGGAEGFYHMMVVDAFSSDAIPIHLLTKEAMIMYFKHLTEDGVLCVHTSNRHLELAKVVADIADDLGYASKRGHDNAKENEDGHSTSEWVMVARKREYLDHLVPPEDYDENKMGKYWTPSEVTGRHVWTDDFSNLLAVYR